MSEKKFEVLRYSLPHDHNMVGALEEDGSMGGVIRVQKHDLIVSIQMRYYVKKKRNKDTKNRIEKVYIDQKGKNQSSYRQESVT